MELAQLLGGVTVRKMFAAAYGRMVQTQDAAIHEVQYDSRAVSRGDLFVAIRGAATDGHQFIDRAIQNGAVAVVLEDDSVPDALFLHTGVLKIVVPDSREALARIAGNFYGHPSRALRLVGVTGTNGKTTTAYLLRSVLETAGECVGLIGTIEYAIGDEILPATHTTPESLELNRLLVEMVRKGCTAAVMEVSSHALALHRVLGLEFRAAAFTNLTQDHLDFHGSMEEYFRAKKRLFDALTSDAVAVTNADDPRGSAIASSTKARVVQYGLVQQATVVARDIRLSIGGTAFTVVHAGGEERIESSLAGRFNAANILAACTTANALGVSWPVIREGVRRLLSVRGRFEQVSSPGGWTAIIDYAHTPDALENCLQTIHDVLPAPRSGRIITVFGCGGDRDAGKRPLMGRIASAMSDLVIVTSDNPRSEDPERIIAQIVAGMDGSREVRAEVDRRKAIQMALTMARRGDVVLLAGKGHETYQVIGTKRTHFDDREEVESFLRISA